MPAGLCFREDINQITNNNSEFLLHIVSNEKNKVRNFEFIGTEEQLKLRKELYGDTLNKNIYSQS